MQLTCSDCRQSFSLTPDYLVKKDHLECPNCGNPVAPELLQALVALAKRSSKPDVYGGLPKGRWHITIEEDVI